jgi:exopolysaccharide biosynthesis WecB/TagA/CpsF family protein
LRFKTDLTGDDAMADAAHSQYQPQQKNRSTSQNAAEQGDGPDHVDFMGLPILRRTTGEMVERIEAAISEASKLSLAFCNANTLLLAHDDPHYRDTLQNMTLINDGIGAELAAKLLVGTSFPENLNGTDFVPALFETAQKPLRIYLLGAKNHVVTKAAAAFEKRYPRHTICGFHDGYFDQTKPKMVIENINESKADVLLVAMGNPAQERFIVQNHAGLNVPVAIGVGALFDFTAGIVPRAPQWMRATKTEWLFRLSREPFRLLHRYTIGVGRFLFVCLKLRLGLIKTCARSEPRPHAKTI